MTETTTAKPAGFRSLLLAFLLAGAAFAGLGQGLDYWSKQAAPDSVFALVVRGDTLLLDSRLLPALRQDLQAFSHAERQLLVERMQAWTGEELQPLLRLPEQGVSLYMDWYYSLPGSWLRLYHAVKGDLPDWLEQQLARQVFEQTGFLTGLQVFQTHYNRTWQQEIDRQLLAGREAWLTQVHQQYVSQQPVAVNLPAPEQVVELDDWLLIDLQTSQLDLQRWRQSAGVSAAAGAGLLALPTARMLASRLLQTTAARNAMRVTLQYLVRMTPRLAAALTVSGQATAAAAPTGPGALVTGLVTLGAFVATDWVLLKAEEALYRDDKEAALRQALTDWQQDFQAQLQAQVASWVQERQAAANATLNRRFYPLSSGG